MAILPSLMQGSAVCAALIESALTMLLYRQVRRYSASLPRIEPPPKRRLMDRPNAVRRNRARGA